MSDKVRQILENRLNSEWASRTPISWDDFKYNPIVGVEFIRCTLDGIFADTLSLRCQREQYLFTIQVFSPYGDGASGNMVLTDQLTDIFLGFSEEYLTVQGVVAERVGIDKEWYQRNVLIEVQYDNHFTV